MINTAMIKRRIKRTSVLRPLAEFTCTSLQVIPLRPTSCRFARSNRDYTPAQAHRPLFPVHFGREVHTAARNKSRKRVGSADGERKHPSIRLWQHVVGTSGTRGESGYCREVPARSRST